MQIISPKYPHCTHVLHSTTEEEIKSTLTRQWSQLIKRLEEQKRQPSDPRQETEA